jgi:protein-tyrosine phosphatase
VHCHILPAVDDGPQDLSESLGLARLLVEEGVTDVVATPHQLGRWDGTNRSADVRRAVGELQQQVHQAGIPLTLHAGGEVRLDERIPMLLKADQVMTLADHGRWLLLELPPAAAIAPKAVVTFLAQAGVGIILAHAERYDSLSGDPNAAQQWLESGAVLQVNAGSLLGGSGERAERAAWAWVERGWVSLLASDAHSTNTRRPRLAEALDAVVRRGGLETARRICIDNPARVLDRLETLG